MYDPNLGRWFAPDPYHQSHSPYSAMANNPVSFVDPSGGEFVDFLGDGGGGPGENIQALHPPREGGWRMPWGNVIQGIGRSAAMAAIQNAGGGNTYFTPAQKENELTGTDIRNLANQLGHSPSGQDVIDFISKVNSSYPDASVTGTTLKNSVPGITNDARTSLGNINRVTKSGNNIVVSGGTKIRILPVLNLNVANGATFKINKLTSNQAIIDVTGVKVGWFNFNQVTVNPTSVTINVGGISTSWNLK